MNFRALTLSTATFLLMAGSTHVEVNHAESALNMTEIIKSVNNMDVNEAMKNVKNNEQIADIILDLAGMTKLDLANVMKEGDIMTKLGQFLDKEVKADIIAQMNNLTKKDMTQLELYFQHLKEQYSAIIRKVNSAISESE